MAFATLPLTPLTPVLSSDLGAAVPLVASLVIQGSTIGGGCFGTLECCLLIFSSKNPFHTHFKTFFSKWMAQEGEQWIQRGDDGTALHQLYSQNMAAKTSWVVPSTLQLLLQKPVPVHLRDTNKLTKHDGHTSQCSKKKHTQNTQSTVRLPVFKKKRCRGNVFACWAIYPGQCGKMQRSMNKHQLSKAPSTCSA